MLDNIYTYYILAVIVGAIVLYGLYKRMRPKIWVSIGMPGKALRKFGYMKYEEQNVAGEVHLLDEEIDKPIARILPHEKENKSIVRILNGELDEDVNQFDYRMRGFVTPDGYIYRQFSPKEEPKLIGYTARPSAPEVPTVKGERKWTEFWLQSRLNAYLGAPGAKEQAAQNRVAESCMDGIAFKRYGDITTEAKACAFTVLYGFYGKKEKMEVTYKDADYSWKDTALISAIVYCILFLITYLVVTIGYERTLIGENSRALKIAIAAYALVWFFVREIKIKTIEKGNSIQPQIDLINKYVGQKLLISITTALCLIGVVIFYILRNYDFIPLLLAISSGYGTTMAMKKNGNPWNVVTNYENDDHNSYMEEETEFDLIPPPSGEISKEFTWELDSFSGKKLKGNITVNFSAEEMTLLREENPYFFQQSGKPKKRLIQEMVSTILSDFNHKERIRYIASYIDHLCKAEKVDELDRLQFTLDFVQEPNIEFMPSKESKSIQYEVEYVRYPDETLFDQEGDMACKSLLTALLLNQLEYDTLFLSSSAQGRSALAVKIIGKTWTDILFGSEEECEKATILHEGYKYIFCEPSGDGFRIGQLPEDIRLDDFDVRVEIPADKRINDDISTFSV